MKKALWALAPLVGLSLVLGWANWPERDPLPVGARADRVVVRKALRQLAIEREGQTLRTYAISLGGEPMGAKQVEGDRRTPEGVYTLDYRNPGSCCFRSLHVSYPSDGDTRRARDQGLEPGGMIMIHGLRNGLGWIGRLHRVFDWTNGCIAVTNREMAELWLAVPDGTTIEIRP